MTLWEKIKEFVGIAPKALTIEEVVSVTPVVDLKIAGLTLNRYDMRSVSGEVVKWIEANIQPAGTEYVIEVVKDDLTIDKISGRQAYRGTDTIITTGTLPLPKVW
jgi:hypothetical protein